MKKAIIAILCLLLVLSAAGCSSTNEAPPALSPEQSAEPSAEQTPTPTPEATPTPTPTPEPTPVQKAQSVLGKQNITDKEGLTALLEIVTEKKSAAIDAVYTVQMEDEALLGAVAEEINYEFDELKAEIDAFEGDDYSLMAEELLAFWSKLDDISTRAAGYAGLCYAMCRGTDIFSFSSDAKVETDLKSFPEGYFFDGYVPPFDAPCYFAYCDEYLEGYGMDEPRMALICATEWSGEETAEYVEAMRENGFYTMLESYEGDGYMWSGCWVGEDGENCYVTAVYSTEMTEAFVAELGISPEFIVLSGNFDFMFCINAAFTYALNTAFS